MRGTQLLAWLICLVIAGGAAILSVHTTARVTLLERRFHSEVAGVLAEQRDLLREIRDSLRSPSPAAPVSPADG